MGFVCIYVSNVTIFGLTCIIYLSNTISIILKSQIDRVSNCVGTKLTWQLSNTSYSNHIILNLNASRPAGVAPPATSARSGVEVRAVRYFY